LKADCRIFCTEIPVKIFLPFLKKLNQEKKKKKLKTENIKVQNKKPKIKNQNPKAKTEN
jgi:hypothetical protein